ncbi:MAG: LytTR family transcriptional regulator [Methanobrevibacter sp.]|nr:LytTR family transcriptional regulator [Candidatus Methanoflexus mossambicus]
MEVELIISKDIENPKAIIKANKLNANIEKAIHFLENIDNVKNIDENEKIDVIPINYDKKINIVQFKDISLIKSANNQNLVYLTKKNKKEGYRVNKRLYELEEILDDSFIRISKSTIVNINQIDFVSPAFNGSMIISLKNGLKDTISRKYLPKFKKRLGMT